MPDLASEFPLEKNIFYLNHAAVAPWPRRSAEAVKAFAEENVCRGASAYPDWLKTEKRLRQRLARLIGASGTHEIALAKSTSEALSMVATGLRWEAGDEIVISSQEFPSNRVAWKFLEGRHGVKVIEVDLDAAETPEDSLLNAIGPRTRLLSISSVQYGSGLRLDLQTLGEHLKRRNILFCVDAIQSVGAAPIDVEHCHIDFLMADGHKWMLGPEGLALFYIRETCLDKLQVNEFGWHMLAARGDYHNPSMDLAADATRFECGSPNLLGCVALEQSLSLLEEVGMAEVERRILDRWEHTRRGLEAMAAIEILSPLPADRHLGILTFRPQASVAHDALLQALKSQGVICAARGGGIRLSPHFYTPLSCIDRALEIVETVTRTRSKTTLSSTTA